MNYKLPYGVKDLVTLDMETFWSADYTLRKMSTTDYIHDPQFKTHCGTIKLTRSGKPGVTKAYDGVRLKAELKKIDWSRTGLICHHAQFDGAILQHHYGITPALYICTMSLARPRHGQRGVSLDRLSRVYGGKGKVRGKSLVDTKGVRDLSPDQLKRLMLYNIDDTDDTWMFFENLYPITTFNEFIILDETIRMYTHPVLHLDEAMVQGVLDKAISDKEGKLKTAKATAEQLGSPEQLAAMLRKAGCEPPMKISPAALRKYEEEGGNKYDLPSYEERPDMYAYAFAKNDLSFQALLKHPRKKVRDIVEARFGVKSNLLEKRSTAIMRRAGVAVRIYLKYAGAHTNRWCLTGNTQITVLRSGVVLDILLPELHAHDLVWDGLEFVTHGGLICRGPREVMTYQSITGTPRHKVFCDEISEATELRDAARKGYTLKAASSPQKLTAEAG